MIAGILARLSDSRPVEYRPPERVLRTGARQRTKDVDLTKSYGPTDRGVGSISWPQDIAAVVHTQLVPNRAIHDESKSRSSGGGIRDVEIESRVQYWFHNG